VSKPGLREAEKPLLQAPDGRAAVSLAPGGRKRGPEWLPTLARSIRTLLLVLLAATAFAYGWRVTRIDFYQFAVGLPNMRHIVAGLLQPELFIQQSELFTLQTPLRVGPGPKEPSVSQQGELRLVVTPRSVEPGERISFEGSGFPPNASGKLLLGHTTARPRTITPITTDAQGRFVDAFEWPEFARDEYIVVAEVTGCCPPGSLARRSG
jgi:hypothetical protein